jgi:hypothetical protein
MKKITKILVNSSTILILFMTRNRSRLPKKYKNILNKKKLMKVKDNKKLWKETKKFNKNKHNKISDLL